MSTSTDGNTHTVTTRVWFVPTAGSESETFSVVIDWSPQVLALNTATNPNPSPTGGFVSQTGGLAVWSNQTVGTANPESDPLKFEVALDCRMRALTSVESTVGIVGGTDPQIYTAAIACQDAA